MLVSVFKALAVIGSTERDTQTAILLWFRSPAKGTQENYPGLMTFAPCPREELRRTVAGY